MALLERDGTRLFYTEYGTGQELLLLHGWCGDGDDWRYQWPAFAHDYRVIVPDLRGHGTSGQAADGDYSPSALARDALEVLDASGAGKAVVAGWLAGLQ